MKTFYIAYYTARKCLKNIILAFVFIALTLCCSYFSKYLTGGISTGKNLKLSDVEKVGYCFTDNNISKNLKSILSSSSLNSKIKLQSETSESCGIDKVKNSKLDSFIYIGSDSNIKFYGTGKFSVSKSVVENYINSVNALYAGIRVMPVSNHDNLKSQSMSVDSESTYHNVCLSYFLMLTFYVSIISCSIILKERKNMTTIRHKAAPLTYTQNFLGKQTGVIFVLLLYSVIALWLSRYLFNLKFNNLPLVFAALLMFITISANIGVAVGSLFKNIYMCVLSLFIFDYALVYSTISNAYEPDIYNGYNFMSVISPHNYTFKILSSLLNSAQAPNNALVILIFMTALTLFAAWALGRRVLYDNIY